MCVCVCVYEVPFRTLQEKNQTKNTRPQLWFEIPDWDHGLHTDYICSLLKVLTCFCKQRYTSLSSDNISYVKRIFKNWFVGSFSPVNCFEIKPP